MHAFTKHLVISHLQAETIARLYYGLPMPKNKYGKPRSWHKKCLNALVRRSLITVDMKYPTQLGLTMLRWYLGKKGERK